MIRIKLGNEIVQVDLGDANLYRFDKAIDYWRCIGCSTIFYKTVSICKQCSVLSDQCSHPTAGEVLDTHYPAKAAQREENQRLINEYLKRNAD